jgi:hypothetical protein
MVGAATSDAPEANDSAIMMAWKRDFTGFWDPRRTLEPLRWIAIR